jgi:hypothetical protein
MGARGARGKRGQGDREGRPYNTRNIQLLRSIVGATLAVALVMRPLVMRPLVMRPLVMRPLVMRPLVMRPLAILFPTKPASVRGSGQPLAPGASR